MRALAVVLAVAAIGSLVVSWASHEQRVDTGWTMYTPFTEGGEGITSVDTVGEPDLDVSVPDIAPASTTYSEYDGMPWDDARLWLGLAIGFAVSATAVGVISLRRPSRAAKSAVD